MKDHSNLPVFGLMAVIANYLADINFWVQFITALVLAFFTLEKVYFRLKKWHENKRKKRLFLTNKQPDNTDEKS